MKETTINQTLKTFELELTAAHVECMLGIEYLDNYNLAEWGELRYAKLNDSGFDLRAAIDKSIYLNYVNGPIIIPSGVKFQIPSGYEVQIRSRSGLAAKHGIVVTNATGTIDQGYKAEIGIILNSIGHSNEPFTIKPGMKIAQAVVAYVPRTELFRVYGVNMNSDRGLDGFGSTGL